MAATDDDRRFRAALANKKTDGVIQELREALVGDGSRHEPWTSGVAELCDAERTLFYERQDGTTQSLKLGSINAAQAKDLSRACSPATLGLYNQDILDEAYCKARTLDAGKVGWLFNPTGRGDVLSDFVSGLFPWCSPNKGIRSELFKLSVFGRGSFFKTHRDTARNEHMLGSLVVLLPISHKGGNLRLMHHGREFIFDGQALLQGSAAPATSVAYVAFFNDVEHEVVHVTSGHRVTVIFNLYFDSCISPPLLQTPSTEHPFKNVLENVLKDPVIQSAHKYLGFGLVHNHPFKEVIKNPKSIELKGSDIILIQTLTELNITHEFLLLYREKKESNPCPFRVLSSTIIDGDDIWEGQKKNRFINMRRSYLIWDREEPRGHSCWYNDFRNEVSNGKEFKSIDVDWVTEPSEDASDRSVILLNGKEPEIEYYYHQLCVVASFHQDGFVNEGGDSDNEDEDSDIW